MLTWKPPVAGATCRGAPRRVRRAAAGAAWSGRGEVLAGEREARGETGDERGGGRPEAARGGDPVYGRELYVLDGQRLVGKIATSRPRSAAMMIGLVSGERLLALAVDVHLERAALEHELVLQVHGEAEGVEAGAHVRGSRGDRHAGDGGGSGRRGAAAAAAEGGRAR